VTSKRALSQSAGALLLATAGIALLLATGGAAPSPAPVAAPVAAFVDDLFALAAVEGNNGQLDMAQMALQRSRSEETRAFAARVIDDDTALGQQFSRIAPAAAASLPDRVNNVDRLALTRLAALPPVQFDQEYLIQQVGDFVSAMTVFSTEAEEGHNPDLKSFAAHGLPILRGHLEQALAASRRLGGGGPFRNR
jgi:putative membrane protein